MKPIVPIIVGPTGIGKTNLSILLAERLPLEIVSADSRQIYRKLDIGTAKPEREIRERIRHHFIDIIDPSEYFSSGRFAKLARRTVKQIQRRDKIPLIAGGSGFYVKSLIDGIFEIEIQDHKIRDSLKQRIDSEGAESLYEELKKIDPALALKIKPRDKQRIVRGLEVYLITGKRLSELQERESEPADFEPYFIGLTMERKQLYNRINLRVDKMLDDGLLVEVLYLKNLGYHSGMNALNTVGYKEVFSYFDNDISYDKMVDLIKRNTRRYAKRQYTWFNREGRIQWFDLDRGLSLESLADTICNTLNRLSGDV